MVYPSLCNWNIDVPFQFSDYVSLATTLKAELPDSANDESLKDNSAQAKLRTAISRAYYGAFREVFFFARNEDRMAEFHDEQRNKGKDHEILITKFQSHNDGLRKAIGDKLLTLRRKRNNADYELESQFIRPREVAILLKEANAVLVNLQALREKKTNKASRLSSAEQH